MKLFILPLITLAFLANQHSAAENEAAYTTPKTFTVTFSPQSDANGISPPENTIWGRLSTVFVLSPDAILCVCFTEVPYFWWNRCTVSMMYAERRLRQNRLFEKLVRSYGYSIISTCFLDITIIKISETLDMLTGKGRRCYLSPKLSSPVSAIVGDIPLHDFITWEYKRGFVSEFWGMLSFQTRSSINHNHESLDD